MIFYLGKLSLSLQLAYLSHDTNNHGLIHRMLTVNSTCHIVDNRKLFSGSVLFSLHDRQKPANEFKHECISCHTMAYYNRCMELIHSGFFLKHLFFAHDKISFCFFY